jgi:hypothetical protein
MIKKSYILTLFTIVFIMVFLASTGYVEAKLLPRFRGSGGSSAPSISTRAVSSIIVSPRFLPTRNGLKVSFSGLHNASSVNYALTYDTNGKQEGVTGSVNPSEGSTSRDILFGTCSSGTCVNHGKIENMKLEVTSKLNSGKTSIKRYRIRV